jgi:NAD(P)-dependent dehydrogenase (short-subunit alcohol dehydrogenase family)
MALFKPPSATTSLDRFALPGTLPDMTVENKSKDLPLLCIGGLNSTLANDIVARCLANWRIAGFLRDPAALDRSWRNEVVICRADADDPNQIEEAVAEIEKDNGEIDAYIHCVGSILLKPWHLTKLEEFRQAIAVNLETAFHIGHSLIPRMMKRKRGTLVFITTIAANKGIPSHEAIAAAKGGLQSMIRSAAATYASHGLRFNCIAPGLVESAMSSRLLGSEQGRATAEKMHPMGKIGRPENIGSLAAWLISNEADWVTGQVFAVDGGMSSIQSKVRAP